MIFLHLRTDYEHVAEAIAHLAEWAEDDSLTLSHDGIVVPGEPISFRVSLEDDTSVLEGCATCRACEDLGAAAPRHERYEVVLEGLQLDARGEAMWHRIRSVANASSGAPTLSRAIPARPLSAAPSSSALVPDASHAAPLRSDDTRVVRPEELLRSTDASTITAIGSEPSIGPTTTLTVATGIYERAKRLAERPGETRTASELARIALRLGLAVLEEQARDGE